MVTKVTNCTTYNLTNSLSVVILNFMKMIFLFSSASQTLTSAPSTPILSHHDSNIHFPHISSSSSPSVPSPDSPTNSNPIRPDASFLLRRSTHTKQSPTWHNDYWMSPTANHLIFSSSPSIDTKYLLHHYLSCSHFFFYAFLTLITAQTEPKTYDEAVGDPLWQ